MEENKQEGSKQEEKIIEARKKKFLEIAKRWDLWVVVFLIAALILGIYIRSQPMADHGGKPGLWDITTNSWTLGPDLDPFLFLRYAKIIVSQGKLPAVDMLRNVPAGYKTSNEAELVPYMIVWTYDVINIFSKVSVDYAAVVLPVIMFALTIISFFLFVREVFVRKDKKMEANLIAIISTFFMIVIPVFLSRTIAGIPEKESVGFFFMFLSFYLFLKAWKSEKMWICVTLGILAGISTTLMSLAWGGVSYIFVTIALASLLAFVLDKVGKKQAIVYSCWLVVSSVLPNLVSTKYTLLGFLTGLDTGMAFIMFLLIAVHFALWNTRLSKIKFLHESKIPKNIISIIACVILLVLVVSIAFGPGYIIQKIQDLNQLMFQPVTGRWSTTVAENRQPYYGEWAGSFGPMIQGIPILFWLFFIGSVFLFNRMISSLKKKDVWVLTFLYILFFFGLVFSRYSATSVFNGENFISKFFYYGSALLLIGSLIYYYVKYHRDKIEGFEKIEFEFFLLFSLFFLCLFTARSAVRLIMVLGPVAPIFLAYLVVELYFRMRKAKDETFRLMMIAAMIIVILLSLYIFWNFYNEVKSEAYNYVPNIYTQQWQKAMEWVRNNTAEDAVFAHWWDYGYWVQSMGNRATVTDGGNAMVYWNYLTGRLVLTGDNQKDALDFLYSHNATHLLIDSSDIGKYTAYSSIGSDKNFDRFAWIPTMASDQKQVQETKDGMLRIYQGGSAIDEDIVYNLNGTQIFLPGNSAAIIGIAAEITNDSIKQPQAVFYYQGIQTRIPLEYAYYNGKFYDFGTGLKGTVRIVQQVTQNAQGGLQIDDSGGLMYLSPRVTRGLMAQLYLLDDPFHNFADFKLVHSQQALVVDSINAQGGKLGDFVLFGEIQGPIKIWEINYPAGEKVNPEYVQANFPASVDWKF